MPKTKNSRQIAALNRENALRQKRANDKFEEDVNWIITNLNIVVTTENRANLCRDFRQLLNRQVFHSIGIDSNMLHFVFWSEDTWDDSQACGFYLAYNGLIDSINIREAHARTGEHLFSILSHELTHRIIRRVLKINDDSDGLDGHGPQFQSLRKKLMDRFDDALLCKCNKYFPFQ